MTFKEKLAKEHPSKVIDTAVGGCVGCPHDYDYEKYSDNEEFCASREPVEEHCRECWNREIPETEKTKSTGFGIKDFIKAAIELKKIKDSFVEAGFTEREAFTLVQSIVVMEVCK